MKELEDLAQTVKKQLKLKFDADSVRFLEGFIERNKARISEDQREGLINSCAAFLGQCIIENYGGAWDRDDNGHLCVSFDENNRVYPFAKVGKQFENGLEDSVFSFYTVIPAVFGRAPILPEPPKKKWWQFWR